MSVAPSDLPPLRASLDPASPCIDICRMQGEVCEGCGRTLDEIAGWRGMSPAAKMALLARLSAQQTDKKTAS